MSARGKANIPKTSLSVLRRACDGDQEAWRQVVELYSPVILHWCDRRFGLDQSTSEDVAQDVCLSLMANLSNYLTNPGLFRSYLLTATHRKVIDVARREKRQIGKARGGTTVQLVLHQVCDPELDDSDDHSGWTESENVILLRKAFDLLRTRGFRESTLQAALRMSSGDETAAEIAADLGITAEAVSKAMYNVSRALREFEGLFDLSR